MSIESNKTLVTRLMRDDISAGNEAVSDEIIHRDFFDHTNPPGLQHGLEGHKGVIRIFKAAFPDMVWEIEEMVAIDDRVVIRTMMKGTNTGDFFGLPATGKYVEVGGMHMVREADGSAMVAE